MACADGRRQQSGMYSYDRIDNGGRRSSERIARDLQSIAVGTVFPALPGATDGFTVVECQPESSLVLGWAPASHAAPAVTWAFVLEEVDNETHAPDRSSPRSTGLSLLRCSGVDRRAVHSPWPFRDGAKAAAWHRRTRRIAAIDRRRRNTARRRMTITSATQAGYCAGRS